jgi:DNA ligase-1
MFSIFHLKSLAKLSGFFVFMLLSFISSKALSNATSELVQPNLMLLKTYEGNRDVSGWVMSEKLDGVRAYWNGKQLISRQGNVFHAPTWFTAGFPDFELDGELWLGRERFEDTLSIVRQKVPDNRWKDITYHVFEVPNLKGGLFERLSVFKKFVATTNNGYLKLVNQKQINSNEEVELELSRILSIGGEGLVIRNPNTLYKTGRLESALKVKLKQDAECVVKGYIDGKGKYKGQVGSLVCNLIPEQVERLFPKLKTEKNIAIKVGSGLTDIQRQNPPGIGAVISFQYMGVTKKGLPRFPVFLRERTISKADKR